MTAALRSRRWRAAHPEKVSAYKFSRRQHDRQYKREYMRRWRAANPERVRAYRREYFPQWYERRKARDPSYLAHQRENLKRSVLNRTLAKYGLTPERYEALVARGCAVCGGPPNGRGRYHFDHDKQIGRFRGLLCSKCNMGLGQFQEDVKLLKRAADYLTEHIE